MTLADIQDTVVKGTVRNLIVLITGIISIVSSFWIGYYNIQSDNKDTRALIISLFQNQEKKDLQQDFEIEKLKDKANQKVAIVD